MRVANLESFVDGLTKKINDAGGCDGGCEYDTGWDAAIAEAIRLCKEFFREYIDGIQESDVRWIDIESQLPRDDKYILISLENFSIPMIGRYEQDEDGIGSFYIGDETEPCSNQNLFVNAWMYLPEKYKG